MPVPRASTSSRCQPTASFEKELCICPHHLLDVTFDYTTNPITIVHLQSDVQDALKKGGQLHVGDRILEICSEEVTGCSVEHVKDCIISALKMELHRGLCQLKVLSNVPPPQFDAAPQQQSQFANIQQGAARVQDPPTEIEDNGNWRPITAEDISRATEIMSQSGRRASAQSESFRTEYEDSKGAWQPVTTSSPKRSSVQAAAPMADTETVTEVEDNGVWRPVTPADLKRASFQEGSRLPAAPSQASAPRSSFAQAPAPAVETEIPTEVEDNGVWRPVTASDLKRASVQASSRSLQSQVLCEYCQKPTWNGQPGFCSERCREAVEAAHQELLAEHRPPTEPVEDATRLPGAAPRPSLQRSSVQEFSQSPAGSRVSVQRSSVSEDASPSRAAAPRASLQRSCAQEFLQSAAGSRTSVQRSEDYSQVPSGSRYSVSSAAQQESMQANAGSRGSVQRSSVAEESMQANAGSRASVQRSSVAEEASPTPASRASLQRASLVEEPSPTPASRVSLQRASSVEEPLQASASPAKRRSSVTLLQKAPSVTSVRLSLVDQSTGCDEAIKWGFDADGAYLKRFSTKATLPAVQELQQVLEAGQRLKSIGNQDVEGLRKEDILKIYESETQSGFVDLAFTTN